MCGIETPPPTTTTTPGPDFRPEQRWQDGHTGGETLLWVIAAKYLLTTHWVPSRSWSIPMLRPMLRPTLSTHAQAHVLNPVHSVSMRINLSVSVMRPTIPWETASGHSHGGLLS